MIYIKGKTERDEKVISQAINNSIRKFDNAQYFWEKLNQNI